MHVSNLFFLHMVVGEGIASPIRRDIDGKYLDQNEVDLKTRYAKFQNDWPTFGVTLMCDSRSCPTRMSVINFLIYCNGVTWFHKSIDATGKTQDSAYLFMVAPKHVPFHIAYVGEVTKYSCYFFKRFERLSTTLSRSMSCI
jgi:hypothetical protein